MIKPNRQCIFVFRKFNVLKAKKYIVLSVLFLLPITVYIFFATGVNNFAKLPILTQNIKDVTAFKSSSNTPITLENKITVLGFFGNEVAQKKGNAFNLAHKIYKKNYQFDDFQFVFLATPDQEQEVNSLKLKLAEIANPSNYHFIFCTPSEIEQVFLSLKTNSTLSSNYSSDLVFIIDKQKNLRGRKDDKDVGTLYGFNAADYAEINNKMGDDIKIILAEYRLALKKYKADRKI